MSKTCARCEKTVYPIEELKCLDKVRKEPIVSLSRHSEEVSMSSRIWESASLEEFESLSGSHLRKECRSPGRRAGEMYRSRSAPLSRARPSGGLRAVADRRPSSSCVHACVMHGCVMHAYLTSWNVLSKGVVYLLRLETRRGAARRTKFRSV